MCKKIASSREAFFKLGMWKNSKTLLKLTVVMKDEEPKTVRGYIGASSVEVCVVGFFEKATRSLTELGFVDAAFRVGKRTVEVECGDDLFVFEEL
jgi:hypothetical protein